MNLSQLQLWVRLKRWNLLTGIYHIATGRVYAEEEEEQVRMAQDVEDAVAYLGTVEGEAMGKFAGTRAEVGGALLEFKHDSAGWFEALAGRLPAHQTASERRKAAYAQIKAEREAMLTEGVAQARQEYEAFREEHAAYFANYARLRGRRSRVYQAERSLRRGLFWGTAFWLTLALVLYWLGPRVPLSHPFLQALVLSPAAVLVVAVVARGLRGGIARLFFRHYRKKDKVLLREVRATQSPGALRVLARQIESRLPNVSSQL